MSASEGLFSRFRMKNKHSAEKTLPGYDPEKHSPVIRSSICTGEQTAGYKDKVSGTFHEVMLIRDQDDLEEFKKLVHADKIPVEY